MIIRIIIGVVSFCMILALISLPLGLLFYHFGMPTFLEYCKTILTYIYGGVVTLVIGGVWVICILFFSKTIIDVIKDEWIY